MRRRSRCCCTTLLFSGWHGGPPGYSYASQRGTTGERFRGRDRPQDKTPSGFCFGKTVLLRRKRTTAELNKHNVEYSEGLFFRISGMSTELVIGTQGELLGQETYECLVMPGQVGMATSCSSLARPWSSTLTRPSSSRQSAYPDRNHCPRHAAARS